MAVIKRHWRTWLAAVALLAGVFLLLDRRETSAHSVAISSPTLFSTLDNGPDDHNATVGVFGIDNDLTIQTGGSIICDDPTGPPGVPNDSACAIVVSGGGSLIMDAGSSIHAENNVQGGTGGNITITVTGDLIMHGTAGATPGAIISANDNTSGGVPSRAGDITITLGSLASNPPVGNLIMEPGSKITANSPGGEGGNIVITAGNSAEIDGTIESAVDSGSTGSGGGRDGGTITVIAGCDLDVSPTGKVSSRGKDQGADLVHLEACVVTINGLVESTGAGHGIPSNPANHCNDNNVAHPILSPPDQGNTGCVEVWSATTITIDSTAPQNGEVNADIGTAGGSEGRGWIDLFARGDITIIGDTVLPYAVHANGGLAQNTDDGGLVTVKSTQGAVITTEDVPATVGLAIQANATSSGSKGGDVRVEASADVNFNSASIQAEGANSGGGAQAGGHISARSFNGFVLGVAPGELNADGGAGQATPEPGVVTLQGCGTGAPADGVAYTGTVTPLPVANPGDACGSSPQLPAGVTLPDAICTERCHPPTPTPTPTITNTPTNTPTPLTPTPGTTTFNCSKAPVRTQLNGKIPDITVLTNGPISIQSAVDSVTDTTNDGYIIVGVQKDASGTLGGHSTQSVVINRVFDKPFWLIGCSVTLHDPTPGDGNPVIQITAGAFSPGPQNIFVMDLHAADSAYAGIESTGNGRYLRNENALSNAVGFKVSGNNNTIHNGSATSNGVGVSVSGDFNTVTDTNAYSNSSHGVQVVGNGNQLLKIDSGDSGKGNGGDGFNVAGDSNNLSEDDAFANSGNGFLVVGNLNTIAKGRSGDSGKGNGTVATLGDGYNVAGFGNSFTESRASANKGDGWDVSGGTMASPNKFKSDLSNTGASGSATLENVGPEYRLLGYVQNNGGGNKADSVTIPAAAKCLAFPASPNSANVNFACGD
jgi:hypothetical protein